MIWQDNANKDRLEWQFELLTLSGLSRDFTDRYVQLKQLRLSTQLQEYDFYATDSLLAYMNFIDQLKQKGDAWLFGRGFDYQSNSINKESLQRVLMSIEEDKLSVLLDNLDSKDSNTIAMKNEIKKLKSVEEWEKIATTKTLRVGNPSHEINNIITSLEKSGVVSGSQAEELTGLNLSHYDKILLPWVKDFQQQHGLNSDGVIGPKTREWFNKSPKERIALLALNIQRNRFWKNNKSSQLVVNIPAYQLSLRLDDKAVLESKVIVGRPSRKTPLLDIQLASIVFNPHWNVPRKLMREDILPKAKRDYRYLENNNYQVLDSWGNNAIEIPPEFIDWDTLDPWNTNYRLRQRPGSNNALGRYKFNTPNNQAIYLHDTPGKRLFKRDSRALSSGCIRVEKARQLVDVVMNYNGLNKNKHTQFLKNRETKYLNVKKKLPVSMIYQTAWADEQGRIQYRDDIYKYDKIAYQHPQANKYIYK
ncbi:L,D-transpeptidase family protein [Vibrio sp. SS-MA-C1-2]|uniref:L,D-transpeptidase family protein n=1 Tax=Vibrio sp. SS-MA-C1-2 TaxID=2908646 RepID=UPI001F00FEF8|nr:L,D-transpeptidase family protein [Vibrio sp. SS-MA-C1-2]